MNGMSILKRVVGAGAAACCMTVLSPLATANADTYTPSYTAVITADSNAAVVSQTARLVNLLPQQPTRVFPQEPTRVLKPVIGLWG